MRVARVEAPGIIRDVAASPAVARASMETRISGATRSTMGAVAGIVGSSGEAGSARARGRARAEAREAMAASGSGMEATHRARMRIEAGIPREDMEAMPAATTMASAGHTIAIAIATATTHSPATTD
jgi:hypothetical protein